MSTVWYPLTKCVDLVCELAHMMLLRYDMLPFIAFKRARWESYLLEGIHSRLCTLV